MIRRFVPALLAVTSAFALAGQAGSPLSMWVAKIHGLKSLQAELLVTEPGRGADTYQVALAKPSSLRVDGPVETILADGTTITVLNKPKNYFYTRPQTDAELRGLVLPDQYALFRAFFDGKAFDGAKNRVAPRRTLGGETVTPIEVAGDAKGTKSFTFYVGPDGLARKGERTTTGPKGRASSVFTAKNVVLDAEINAEAFAFKPPTGAEQIQYADLVAGKWFTDLDEAKGVAKATGRRILIDFSAERSELWKEMERELYPTSEFKALGGKYVFLRIDAETQPTVAAAFKIEAIPTQVVAEADGTEVGRSVGYEGTVAFFEFINGL